MISPVPVTDLKTLDSSENGRRLKVVALGFSSLFSVHLKPRKLVATMILRRHPANGQSHQSQFCSPVVMSPNSLLSNPDASAKNNYVVVARRFRPQTFEQLIGQENLVTILKNAIEEDKVGHAYLFTGSRGVGKTTTARIFAKCLNCQEGLQTTPCLSCDSCQAIAVGEDVDVIEIDGASNRRIEEIRELRANVNVRPSRSRNKIYIIDEVHMLTREAFNALLKTLEEPPEHVKFFFCTTNPEKIPITVLSRCQRFDLKPIAFDAIKQHLRDIATALEIDIEEGALEILARRANGSMRDSQSLLDQLYSFCGNTISGEDANKLLGVADSGRVMEILASMLQRDSAQSLNQVDQLIKDGVDAGQLTNQLLSLTRDLMALRVGCDSNQLLFCNQVDFQSLQSLSTQHSLESILAIVDILDHSIVRAKHSDYPRTLLEVAVVRICNLPDLQQVADLVEQFNSGTEKPPEEPKKKRESGETESPVAASGKSPRPPGQTRSASAAPTRDAPNRSPQRLASPPSGSPSPAAEMGPLTESNCELVWKTVLNRINDMTSDLAGSYSRLQLEGDCLTVEFPDRYHQNACSRADRKQRLEEELAKLAGREIRIDFAAHEVAKPKTVKPPLKKNRVQQIREIERRPFVQKAIELFDAEITEVIEPRQKRKFSELEPESEPLSQHDQAASNPSP